MSDFYWELVEFDGTVTKIPPEAVATVKQRWNDGQPIHTTNQSIPANQIKHFRATSERYGVPLIEAAARAFQEPLETEDGDVEARWVKKLVPQREAAKLLAIPAYRNLGTEHGLVLVAFKAPVHLIDTVKVDYCDANDLSRLTNK